MTRLELAPEVLDDFDRILDHLEQHEAPDLAERIEQIVQSLQVLTHSPLIGRPAGGGRRELVIGAGTRGYVALYRYVAPLDVVFVLAIRGQRERGYDRR